MSDDLAKIINEFRVKSENDFGFSTTTDDPVITKIDMKKRMQDIENLIMPLLVNLLETADKPVIKWPDRKPILEEKIKALLSLTRGS